MKKMKIVLRFCLLVSTLTYAQKFKKIAEEKVNQKEVSLALNFATDYFEKLESGGYYAFQDEVTGAIKELLTEKAQRKLHKEIEKGFGKHESIKYAETWTMGNMKVYRLKGKFEKSHKKLELRVVLDDAEKIVGYWIKPWSDVLK